MPHICVFKIIKEKLIDQYLDAAEFIKSKYSYEDKFNELQRIGVIEYHGMQKEVRGFHKISPCTIHLTYYPEGMSNVLFESAVSGRPIITTN